MGVVIKEKIQLPRPFVAVLIVIASMLPDEYLANCYSIFRSHHFNSPENLVRSWTDLCSLVDKFFTDQGLKGLSIEDFPENERLIGMILSSRIDYQKYLKVTQLPPKINQEKFIQIINQNRRLIGN